MIAGKKVCVLIPAAGEGARMGAPGGSKLLVLLGGVPVLVRTLQRFQAAAVVDEIVLALRPGDQAAVEELIAGAGISKVRAIVPGGDDRQDSVRLALAAAVPRGPGIVLVHDGARPFVDGGTIDRVTEAAWSSGAAFAAVRPKDTVKIEEGPPGRIGTPERGKCWLAQTPQGFRTEILVDAMERAVSSGFHGTDDVSLVERLGGTVVIVEGSPRNIKITTPADLEIGEFLLKIEG